MTKHRAFNAFFVTTALVLTAPFAVSTVCLSGLAALAGLRAMSVAVPLPWIVFFDGPNTAVAMLFADLTRYMVFSLLAVLLLTGALIRLAIRSRQHVVRIAQFYLLVLGIGCVLGFAWLHQYEPAVRPAPNAQLQMVQAPDLLTGIVRRNQASAEIPGCAFEVLGWADADSLVYREWCGGFYDPSNHYAWKEGAPAAPRAYRVGTKTDLPYAGDLKALSRETCGYASCVRPLLDKDYVHTFSRSPRYPTVPDDSVLSPDGKWVTFRAKHVYGPEDLLIIGPSKQN